MHILIIGAHPGDGEIFVGGTAALWRRRGDRVKFLSLTDGSRSHFDRHYADHPEELVRRCEEESSAAASVIGAEYGSLGVPDGSVFVTPELTELLVREIRRFGPEPGTGPTLIVINRPFDRPRDHAHGAQLVLDAAGICAMPLVCADILAPSRVPTIAYWHDDYTEIAPFEADLVVPIDSALDEKTRLVAAHESQVFEWLPYSRGLLDHVPVDPAERTAWLRHGRIEPMGARVRAYCTNSLHAALPHGRYAEAFQISEYGHQPSISERAQLFPSSHFA
ncbi:MAG: PIG-L deacetylase family protein [Capsulimonadaceae bacterium]